MPRDDADNERWRLEIFRDRLRHSLAARFVLRFHVSLILAASIATGWAVDRALLAVGSHSMLSRYPLAILGAYLAFLGGVAAWLRYSGIRQYVSSRRARELVGDEVPRGGPLAARPASRVDIADLAGFPGDIDGCLIALGLAAIFFALGGYLVVVAPSFFADVVLELLLAAGLLRGIRRVESSGWIAGVWGNTWPTLAFVLALALLAGWLARSIDPPARTLPELVAHHWHAPSRR